MQVIQAKNLSYQYPACGSNAYKALNNISFTINKGEFIGIVGTNGSGKSTLIQHFNGLLCPTEGQVRVLGDDTGVKEHREKLWQKVGLVFQYPEQQLFEATVFDDVAYGIRNLGLKAHEVETKTRGALQKVGLSPEAFAGQVPLSLSGGQRRRVAIAGVLAMEPEILVLDEPTAGLDYSGRQMILNLIKKLQQEENTTVVMVSHSMREVIALADKIMIMNQGKLLVWGTVKEIMENRMMKEMPPIIFPEYIQVIDGLKEKGVNPWTVTFDEAEAEIERFYRRRNDLAANEQMVNMPAADEGEEG